MPIEELFLLADIYKAQARLEDQGVSFFIGMPGVLAGVESGEGVRAALLAGQLHLSDVVAAEEGLIQLYDRALGVLDAKTPAPAATRKDDGAAPKG